jgi:hypothetical protein
MTSTLDIFLSNVAFTAEYKPVEEYIVKDTISANKIIEATLNQLYPYKLFGSGWPVPSYMKKPIYVPLDKELFIYDQAAL